MNILLIQASLSSGTNIPLEKILSESYGSQYMTIFNFSNIAQMLYILMVVYNNIYVPILLDNCVILSNYNFCPSNKYKGYLGYQSTFLCLSTYVYIFLCMVIYIPFSDLVLCPSIFIVF